MNNQDFRALAIIRLREAEALLSQGHFEGAYYLGGYCIECALKACIASQTRAGDFPEKDRVNKSYSHNLETLLRTALLDVALEQEMKTRPALRDRWNTLKDWNETSRY